MKLKDLKGKKKQELNSLDQAFFIVHCGRIQSKSIMFPDLTGCTYWFPYHSEMKILNITLKVWMKRHATGILSESVVI